MEQNDFSNFGIGSPKKYSCGIILNSGHWSMRICRLKVFSISALAAILFKATGPFFASLVEGHPRNLSVKPFCNLAIDLRGYVI